MIEVIIDGQSFEVEEGHNLLEVSLSLGFDIPYFCWHPALGSVGACRQCAVKHFKDEDDEKGRIVMACMTPAEEGTRVALSDPEARDFRARIIEYLMLNHPHDCPVCDEGGECHLQDMTVMTGHVYRRTRFPKRTFLNQDLGPFLHHEMNRCIECYRCVRFYRDHAGGRDLDVFGAHENVYFGRHRDGALESEFSGNLVEICPTGVFTDRTLRGHYVRKWDLSSAPSICAHCGVGCNTLAAERAGTLRRIQNRYNSRVNGYFLCDRGRFGYEYLNGEGSLRAPLVSNEGSGSGVVEVENALGRATALLEKQGAYIGVGSPRASMEANFALRRLVGEDRFYGGLCVGEDRRVDLMLEHLRKGPARTPSLSEVETAGAVLILGEDLTQVAPRMALAVRQSVRHAAIQKAGDRGVPPWHDAAVRDAVVSNPGRVFLLHPHATRLDDVASRIYRAAPMDLARIGFAVAHGLDEKAPAVDDLRDDETALVEAIVEALREAEHPVVISGPSCGEESLIHAAANVASSLCALGKDAGLGFTTPECNTLGAALLGGHRLEEAFQAAASGKVSTVIVLENDLYRRAAPAAVDKFLHDAGQLIALDHIETETTRSAGVVLPCGSFAESDGTWVSSEGRAQRFYKVLPVTAGSTMRESWRWLSELLARSSEQRSTGEKPGRDIGWDDLDELRSEMARSFPELEPLQGAAPPASFRMLEQKIPRQSARFSGRTALHAHQDVHEPKPPEDPGSPLRFSMEGYTGQPPSALITQFHAPLWNSIQSVNKFQQEVGGPLRGGDPGVRLIAPSERRSPSYHQNIPDRFRARDGSWYVLPLYHIFGSEELSSRAPAVRERSPNPYLALHPTDAERVGLDENAMVEIVMGERPERLPVRLWKSLPLGVVGLPIGLLQSPGFQAPVWTSIAKVRTS